MPHNRKDHAEYRPWIFHKDTGQTPFKLGRINHLLSYQELRVLQKLEQLKDFLPLLQIFEPEAILRAAAEIESERRGPLSGE